MTDEEMAKEYADTVKCEWENDTYWVDCRDKVTDAFLAGLKAASPKWHDLREDPNDLPNGYRVVLNQVGMATQYDPNRGFLGFGGAGIIAWCEIPIFDKE